jgi:hypothetical protein|tara:strand:+ start:381 stop:596 length:216 start_codon:yes stop_codon:yes gene_type:complete
MKSPGSLLQEWSGAFGGTADAVKSTGNEAYDTYLVTGLRFGFSFKVAAQSINRNNMQHRQQIDPLVPEGSV